MKRLSECKKMRYCIFSGFDESMPFRIRRRMCELGFIAGQKVRLVRCSLLKRAFLVELRGYTLSLRKSIVEGLLVKE